MLVPVAAMNKYHSCILPENNIWPAWEAYPVQPESKTLPVQVAPNGDLRFRIATPDG